MEALLQPMGLKMVFCFAVGLFTSFGMIPLIRERAIYWGGRDRAKELHHIHTARIERLGGAALIAAFVAIAITVPYLSSSTGSSARTLEVIAFGAVAMFVLGLLDDLKPLGARLKLAVQVVIATVVYGGGIRIEVLKNPFTEGDFSLGFLGFFVSISWLVSLPNLINLIDGIDGLAGGICLMLMALLADLGMGGDMGFPVLVPIGVAGALLGFLKFNYPPAKIYMGDSGAYFLGFLIAALSIVNSNKGTVVAALIAPAFALALPIVDVGLAILRRGLRGLPIFRPDQKHIHHYLITLGFSRERAVLILYTASLFCLLIAFGALWLQGRLLPLFSGLLFSVFLIAGHASGFTKDWFALGCQLPALRKETRHALALSEWLVTEVERHRSVDELWEDYQFVIRKLGFVRVNLFLPGGCLTWQIDGFDETAAGIQKSHQKLGDGSVVEFAAETKVLPEHIFKLLAELGAETWHKAAVRWRLLNKAPLAFIATGPFVPLLSKESLSFCAPLGQSPSN